MLIDYYQHNPYNYSFHYHQLRYNFHRFHQMFLKNQRFLKNPKNQTFHLFLKNQKNLMFHLFLKSQKNLKFHLFPMNLMFHLFLMNLKNQMFHSSLKNHLSLKNLKNQHKYHCMLKHQYHMIRYQPPHRM